MTDVTAEDVERIASGYDEDPARSMSLRADAYTDARWAGAELRAIFGRTWHFFETPELESAELESVRYIDVHGGDRAGV